MFRKAEIYSELQLISKVKFVIDDEDGSITIIPRNRNEFISFYPDETFTIHYTDEKGVAYITYLTFEEIVLIRTRFYYRFRPTKTVSFADLVTERDDSIEKNAILYFLNSFYQVTYKESTDTNITIFSSIRLNQKVDLYYYMGKKKILIQADISSESKENDLFCYFLSIERKEVI